MLTHPKTQIKITKTIQFRKATGSYRTYSIPGKTAALIPEFAVKDLPLTELQPRFLRLQWRACPWAEHSDDDISTLGLCNSILTYNFMFKLQQNTISLHYGVYNNLLHHKFLIVCILYTWRLHFMTSWFFRLDLSFLPTNFHSSTYKLCFITFKIP